MIDSSLLPASEGAPSTDFGMLLSVGSELSEVRCDDECVLVRPDVSSASGCHQHNLKARAGGVAYWVSEGAQRRSRVSSEPPALKRTIQPKLFKGTRADTFFQQASSSKYVSRHSISRDKLLDISRELSSVSAVSIDGVGHLVFDHLDKKGKGRSAQNILD